MTRQSLTRMLKTVAKQAGINEPFQGHSPRRGFVTSAWLKGARGETIKTMGWNSNVWERYVEGLGGLNDHPFHTEK
jgi:site-specific recombinase XerD